MWWEEGSGRREVRLTRRRPKRGNNMSRERVCGETEGLHGEQSRAV